MGRFINADVYILTGKNIFGSNLFAYCENNPVSRIDLTGYNSLAIAPFIITAAPKMTAIFPAITAALQSILPMMWNVLYVILILAAILLTILLIYTIASNIMKKVEERVTGDRLSESGYIVYVLTRSPKKPQTIFYVGRTKNYTARMRNHTNGPKKKGTFYDYPVVNCTNEASSKIVEQAVLSACIITKVFTMGVDRTDPASNIIRGIAKKNIQNIKKNMDDLKSLASCTIDSDLLCLMEQ